MPRAPTWAAYPSAIGPIPCRVPWVYRGGMTTTHTFFADLTAEAPLPARGIHSQTLSDEAGVELVMFAFAAGERLSEHTSARPAIIHILSGECDLTAGRRRLGGRPGSVAPDAGQHQAQRGGAHATGDGPVPAAALELSESRHWSAGSQRRFGIGCARDRYPAGDWATASRIARSSFAWSS